MDCRVLKVFGAVLLLLGLTLLAEADINNITALHVTPVQYVSNGDIVQLKCGINVSTAVSKVLPDDLRITWYDGFIPIPAMGNVHEINGYQLRQTIVNISVTGWLQFGRYVCKIEYNNGIVTTKSTAVIPEGMREEDILSDVTPEHPGVVTVTCPVASSSNVVHWDKLSLDLSKQSSYRGVNFPYNLFSYNQSAKFVCYSEHLLHSIIYVHPKDYDPVRFIYPKENTTLVFDNLDSKLIECRITGSVKPNMSWIHKNVISPNNVYERVYSVNSFIDKSTHILQLIMNSLIPFLDTGEYVCVVENEWETVNQSVTILFQLLKRNPFQITTFAPVQYMFEGVDFTSRCFIQVDKNRQTHSKITTNVLFYKSSCNNATSTYPTLLQNDSKIELISNERYDDNGDMWIIIELTIFNTTVNDSGCYQCLAASFDHTNNSLSNVIFMQTPFNITSYEPEITLVERGSSITLLCEITVDKDYDMDLVSVYYRYYAIPQMEEYVKYNADINTDTVNKTITAGLNLTLVDIQHLGLYECYARSLPADLYIDPDDSYYEVSQNTTVNATHNTTVNATHNTTVNATTGDSVPANDTLMIVLVTSLTAALVTVLPILLIVIICMKKHRSKKIFDAISRSRSAKRWKYNEYCDEPSTISLSITSLQRVAVNEQ